MQTTLIIITALLVLLASGFHFWSQYIQRSQPPGRHRTVEVDPVIDPASNNRPAHRQSRAA